MTLFGRIKRFLNLALNDEKAWNPSLWNLRGSQSLSGEVVTEETSLTYSAVFNAVALISGTSASLPCHLMQQQNGKKRIADNVLPYRTLHDRANPYMTAMGCRETIMSHVLTWGNGYAEIVRNGYGEVEELWPIEPNRITNIQPIDGKLWYEIRVDAVNKWLPREKILHIPGLGFDGVVGYSPIAMARKSLGLGMALETFGALYFGQGTHPGIILSHPGQVSAAAAANIKESFLDESGGLFKSHGVKVLEEGMKLEKIGIPPNDAQFLESRQFQITEVARWFNLPVHKLKEMSKSSFNNIESEQASFISDSILPWLVRLEQNYWMQLLAPAQQRENFYFKHNLEGILRASAADRAKFYQVMIQIGAFSINEVRELEDKNPVEGGDVHLIPMNMTTLENAGKVPEPKQITEGKNEITEQKPVQTEGEGGS